MTDPTPPARRLNSPPLPLPRARPGPAAGPRPLRRVARRGRRPGGRPTAERVFTPLVTLAVFLSPGPLRRPLLPRRRRPPPGLACRPRPAPLLARHRRLLQGPRRLPEAPAAPAGARDRRPPPGSRPRRLARSAAAAWSWSTARPSPCPTRPRTRPPTPSTSARSPAAAPRSPGSSSCSRWPPAAVLDAAMAAAGRQAHRRARPAAVAARPARGGATSSWPTLLQLVRRGRDARWPWASTW